MWLSSLIEGIAYRGQDEQEPPTPTFLAQEQGSTWIPLVHGPALVYTTGYTGLGPVPLPPPGLSVQCSELQDTGILTLCQLPAPMVSS